MKKLEVSFELSATDLVVYLLLSRELSFAMYGADKPIIARISYDKTLGQPVTQLGHMALRHEVA